MQGSLAEKLRVLRAQRGLSLMEAAERTGVTRDTLSELERGKRHPYTPTLTKIAKGYGVSVEDLLELEEFAPSPKIEAPSPLDVLGERWRKAEAKMDAALDEEEKLDALTLGELEELHSYLGEERDAVARAMVRKARGWTEEPLSAKQRERRETQEDSVSPREGNTLLSERFYRGDPDLFRATIKDISNAKLRDLGEVLGAEFSHVRTRDELLEEGSAPDFRRVRAFSLAGIVNEELVRRGAKPLRDIPAFRRFDDALADDVRDTVREEDRGHRAG